MIIKHLSLKNIRSYESVDVPFEKGASLLLGNIGSGKSSILLGLQFALFGLQPGQKGSSLLRHGADSAYARVTVEIDSSVIDMERTIKKGKGGTITQDSNVITTNGVREELSTSEMKSRVIDLLEYPREFAKKSNLLYKFTVYTPQEEMKAIIEERPEVRLDTIRHIFGFDRYKRIKENAGILLSKIKDSIKIKEVLIAELQLLKEKLQIESERKIGLAREVNNLDLEVRESSKQKEAVTLERKVIEEKVKKARELESDLAREKALLIGKRELEVKLSRDMVVMQREISDPADFSVDRLNAVSELLIKHKGVLDEKRKMYMDINLAITRIESQKEAPFTLKQKIMSMDNCPTCQQIVSSEHKEKIDKRTGFEIDELSHSLEHKIVERNQLSTDIEKVSDLISGYESDLRNLREAQMKFEQQKNVKIKLQSEAFTLDRTKQEILQLEARVTELVSQELSEEDKIKSTEVIAREDALNKKLRLHEITFAEKQRELKLVRERLEELNIEVTKKEKVKLQIVYLRNLQDWVNEKFLSVIMLTEKNVLSKLRMEFSNVFTEWFSLLVSDDLSVRLDEDFTPIIMQQDYEIEYAFLSGGERTAVALSYRLSLHQVLNSMLSRLKTKNLLILDEPTDGFAAEQIDKMRDLFDALDTEQLILVSHEQKMEGFVDRIIRVSKGESSRLEEVSG